MCDRIVPCFNNPQPIKNRNLTLLLLDCWQREYDQMPYRNFVFENLWFEERMRRSFNLVRDFTIIVKFIKLRPQLQNVKLVGLQVADSELVQKFVASLKNLRCIELKLMNLPRDFFEILAENVGELGVEDLLLEGTPLTDCDILNLRQFIIDSRTLQKLHVGSCSINQYNIANLADGVHKSQTLKAFTCNRLLGNSLNLDSQKIALVLSSLIWQNKLQAIEMEKCEMNASDMEIIAEYLYNENSNLLKLNVAYNKIAANGAEYLLKAISHSGTLKYLNMNGCGLVTH
ncbi:uncharacterized protein LOC133333770, partial [Musca vetustissima]|uniref:uncharacterized protein LOC133333770 n=1 Tax=Musca vetustissima TaxID=27455 RepID=UPI002AB721A3